MTPYLHTRQAKALIAFVCSLLYIALNIWWVYAYTGDFFGVLRAIDELGHVWIGISCITGMVLILRIFRVIRKNTSFWFLLAGMLNTTVGAFVLIISLPDWISDFDRDAILYMLNVLAGSYMLWEFFSRRKLFMFPRLRIILYREEPAAVVSDKTLERIILREFGNLSAEVKRKLEQVRNDGPKGKNRISAAILKLANRDLAALDHYIQICNNDDWDVLSQAEYPRFSKDPFNTPKSKWRRIFLADWKEYSSWLRKTA